MEARKSFSQILKADGRMKFLLGGIVLDGALLLALMVTAGIVFAL
jgi:hypothetical protein